MNQELSQEDQAAFREGMQRMLIEVKRKFKSESKNGLIRIMSALLVDNFMLKTQIDQLLAERTAVKETEKTNE